MTSRLGTGMSLTFFYTVGLGISDPKLTPRRRNKWFVPTEFRMFHGTENSQNSGPNHSEVKKMLGILYRGTEIEANSRNSFRNHSVEEETTRNSIPWKNTSKLSEFRSEPFHGRENNSNSILVPKHL